ncbi:MAG TPA: dihydroorotase [Gammaproteobacteria bacterium]|mgnify:FL=1|nr:dihydroorotase [Gammaproteobacteria bacterium]
MSVIIRNMTIVSPGSPMHGKTDIGISEGIFVDPQTLPRGKEIDGQSSWLVPGLIDCRFNLREPGLEHKGTIASETLAAVAGGVTTVVAIPATDPVIETPADVGLVLERASASGYCRVLPTAMLTQGGEGSQLSEMAALMDAGCVALAQGNRPFRSRKIEYNALKYAQSLGIRVILDPESRDFAGGCAHAGRIGMGLGLSLNSPLSEILGLGADLDLVEATGVAAHFSRITSKNSVERIRRAKAEGLNITCDVTLAHLVYSESAIANLDPNFHLERPLRAEDDRLALISGIADGTIDLIVSDHSPHETGAKLAPFPETEQGMSIAEGIIQLLMQLDKESEVPFEISLAAMTTRAARFINQDRLGAIEYGNNADCVLINPKETTEFNDSNWLSAGRNSPLIDAILPGQIVGTWINGKHVAGR